jgi:hypothetical protein
MYTEKNLLKKGQFHYVYDESDHEVVIEDRTKRGLPVLEQSVDDTFGLVADKGRLYDANGRGHIVSIRWYLPKQKYTLEQIYQFGESLDSRYRAIMELTCPNY